MPTTQFPRPATVLVRHGAPRRIASVLDAYACLTGIAAQATDEALEAAIAICQLAMIGTVSAEEANEVFLAYASRCDIMVDDISVESIAKNRDVAA
jgi:hypothetical protein